MAGDLPVTPGEASVEGEVEVGVRIRATLHKISICEGEHLAQVRIASIAGGGAYRVIYVALSELSVPMPGEQPVCRP